MNQAAVLPLTQAARHECDPQQLEDARRQGAARADHGGRDAGDAAGEKGMRGQMSDPTGLEFTGRLKNVQMVAPKEKNDYQGQRLEGGALVITLEVPRPALPSAPKPDYRLTRYKPYGGYQDPPSTPKTEKPEDPDDLEQAEGESEDAFDKRYQKAEKALDKWERENQDWEAFHDAEEAFLAEQRTYEERVQGEGGKFAAWMHLAGVGAVLQGMPVSINLAPDNSALEKYLPGFSPALALSPPPASQAAEQEAAG